MGDDLVTVFLCGDVMTGRGVDQILPHPGDPRLWETGVQDARDYVELAEAANGPIPRPVDFAWPWGDALDVLEEFAPDVRVMNLETSVTQSDDAEDKAVNYRMSPENVPCLTVARPDACALANNHVLDFGHRGLADTCEVLTAARIPAVGAGRDADEARRSVIVPARGGGRVMIFSFGARSSGIPGMWAATADRPGVALIPDMSGATASDAAARMRAEKRLGDVVVASVHWGSNWGYRMPADHIEFAHRLIDGGVDIVHGHSSHHVRPAEVYRGKLILYGCGDLIDDYEGIGGYGEFRADLRLLYFATVRPATGRLVRLRMAPLQPRQMRLHHASSRDAEQLRAVLDRTGRDFGSRYRRAPDGMLELQTERR